jgi:hypothetical protein
MSLAMWEMYGGGESVAVRSTTNKLKGLIENNASFLEHQGLAGNLAEVEYLEGLKNPSDDVQDRIYEILFERDRDLRLGLFAIKPDAYVFEQEVRAILYPKRDLLGPIEDPHPNLNAVSLPFPSAIGSRSLVAFIDAVYLHPMLDSASLIVQAVAEINRRFDVEEIPIVADKIEALGSDVRLP